MLVSGLQRRLEAATKERDAYVGFLKQVNASVPTDDEIKESQAALTKARKEEEEAIAGPPPRQAPPAAATATALTTVDERNRTTAYALTRDGRSTLFLAPPPSVSCFVLPLPLLSLI
jgi:hypothetical protein